MNEFQDKLRSLSLGRNKGSKVTVDQTDHTVNTITEHWNETRDVHVEVRKPVSNKEKS